MTNHAECNDKSLQMDTFKYFFALLPLLSRFAGRKFSDGPLRTQNYIEKLPRSAHPFFMKKAQPELVWNYIETDAFKLFCSEVFCEAEKRGEKLDLSEQKKYYMNGEFTSFRSSRLDSNRVSYYAIYIKNSDSNFGFIVKVTKEEKEEKITLYKMLPEHCLLTLMNGGKK